MTDEHHDPSFTPARFPAKRALNELLGGKKTCMVTGWEQASVVMHVLLRTSGFEEVRFSVRVAVQPRFHAHSTAYVVRVPLRFPFPRISRRLEEKYVLR